MEFCDRITPAGLCVHPPPLECVHAHAPWQQRATVKLNLSRMISRGSLAPLFWAQWSIEAEVGAGKSEARLRACALRSLMGALVGRLSCDVSDALLFISIQSQLRHSQLKHTSGFLKVGAGF